MNPQQQLFIPTTDQLFSLTTNDHNNNKNDDKNGHKNDHGSGSDGFKLVSGSSDMKVKKKRGRPRGYGGGTGVPEDVGQLGNGGSGARERSVGVKKQQKLMGLGVVGLGGGINADIITVNIGEDIASKVMAYQRLVQYTICILSANGDICNITLRQPSTYGGTIRYEGNFQILSLSGTFFHVDNGSYFGRTSGMSVSLSASDGRILGGGVAGALIAATPIQVVVGSFIVEEKKLKPQVREREPFSALPHMMNFGSPIITLGAPITTVSPPSQDTLSESSNENGSGGNSRPSNYTIQFSKGVTLPHVGWANLHSHEHMTKAMSS